jgi:hypothetical protein
MRFTRSGLLMTQRRVAALSRRRGRCHDRSAIAAEGRAALARSFSRAVSVVAAGVVLAVTTPNTHAGLNLEQPDGVAPPVAVLIQDRTEFTDVQVQATLVSELRARPSGLRIDSACANTLYFRVVRATAISSEERRLRINNIAVHGVLGIPFAPRRPTVIRRMTRSK